MILGDVLVRNARLHPGRAALTSDDGVVTYRDLLAWTRRYGDALRNMGFGKGDRAAVLSRSTPAYVELLFAATSLGGVVVPLNQLLIPRELRGILEDARPRFLFYEGMFEEQARAVRDACPRDVQVYRLDRSPDGTREILGAPGSGGQAPPLAEGAAEESDTALQVYSGGTPGSPRGAMLSHRNLLSASCSAALELGLSRNDVFLSASPLPFIAGMGRLLKFLYVGGSIVLLHDESPEGILQAIERHKVTHVMLTPAMMAQILDDPGASRFNLASLRQVTYGGGMVPVDLLKRAIRFFRCDMFQSYGQIESAGLLTFLRPEDHSLDENVPYMRRLTSVGQEAVGVEIRVVDRSEREIPPNQVGEVIARGPNVFQGYYRDPAATGEVLRDGWLRTGDMGSVDEEGYLSIVDRVRDALMIGGIPVSPREIEGVLGEHPAVSEAAVVGRPDYVLGEVPVAVVVLREGVREERDSILDHCRRNMAPFKVPREVEFIRSLPRNSQGKVLKVKVKERMIRR